MAHVTILEPHDPLPTGPEDFVLVLARFDDREPNRVITEVTLHRHDEGDERGVVRMDEGMAAGFDDAIRRARQLAGEHGIGRVYALDRTRGPLERSALDHHGERRFEGRRLDDGGAAYDNVDVSGMKLRPDPEVERDLGHRRDMGEHELDPKPAR